MPNIAKALLNVSVSLGNDIPFKGWQFTDYVIVLNACKDKTIRSSLETESPPFEGEIAWTYLPDSPLKPEQAGPTKKYSYKFKVKIESCDPCSSVDGKISFTKVQIDYKEWSGSIKKNIWTFAEHSQGETTYAWNTTFLIGHPVAATRVHSAHITPSVAFVVHHQEPFTFGSDGKYLVQTKGELSLEVKTY